MNLLESVRKRYYLLVALFFFAITFLVYFLTGEGRKTPYDYFVPLADAFAHGRIYLLEKPVWLNEILSFNGNFYVIYPPMPAILLLPQVFISGLEANQTLASVFWGSVNVVLVYFLMRRLSTNIRVQLWITVLFGFGTIHWYLASVGKAWYFAHVTSFLFLILAIIETFGRKRPLLIGLLLGASFWCRLPVVLSLPFFLIMLSDKWITKKDTANFLRKINYATLIKLGLGIGIFVVLNFVYNYVRFGTLADIAYKIQAAEEPWFYPNGLFHISYMPDHLWVFFLKPPVFSLEPPYIKPDFMGMSIFITTPAFIYSFFAGFRNKVSAACWSAILPVALVSFVHGGIGWQQFGYRFAMDFYPFLLVLTALGINKNVNAGLDLTWDVKAMICLSVLINLWGVIWINKFGWVVATYY